jgi:glycosyltransferase involved in cell wall biosynthesis
MRHLRIESYPASPKPPEERPAFQRIGIFNDYVRIPYANGSSFASQFLYREFGRLGSEVTVIGPHDPKAEPHELPPRNIQFPSVPLRNHPGVHLPMPGRSTLRRLADANFSVTIAQTCTALLDAGAWLRRNHGVPFVCVNTVHLPSVYDVLLPQALHKNPVADALFQNNLVPWVERATAEAYNGGDGLVVLSRGLERYWRERGVRVPIFVIPRSVEPKIFDQRNQADPFPAWARRGSRLLVVCRHTREKNVQRLLDVFAREIAPKSPHATLTLVGDGPDHDLFKAHARRLGVFDRCLWPGEISLTDMPAWYRHADVFLYTSLSETYGQVISEALWCGLPVVAFEDHMGVSDQVAHAFDGFLVDPDASDADAALGHHTNQLLSEPELRRRMAEHAETRGRHRSDPLSCVRAYEAALAAAQEHAKANPAAPAPLLGNASVLRWTMIHTLLAALGLVRAPAVLNRHNRRPPDWDLEDLSRETTPPPPLSTALDTDVASVA